MNFAEIGGIYNRGLCTIDLGGRRLCLPLSAFRSPPFLFRLLQCSLGFTAITRILPHPVRSGRYHDVSAGRRKSGSD